MTTLTDIRDGLTAAAEAAWNDNVFPLHFENTTEIDLDTAPDMFGRCVVKYDGGKQANVSKTPFQRNYGTLVITVFIRESLGTRRVLQRLDALSAALGFKTFGGIHTQEAEAGNDVTKLGWFSMDLRVPFFADSNA